MKAWYKLNANGEITQVRMAASQPPGWSELPEQIPTWDVVRWRCIDSRAEERPAKNTARERLRPSRAPNPTKWQSRFRCRVMVSSSVIDADGVDKALVYIMMKPSALAQFDAVDADGKVRVRIGQATYKIRPNDLGDAVEVKGTIPTRVQIRVADPRVYSKPRLNEVTLRGV